MEDRALEVERLAGDANSLLAGAKSAEVLNSLRHRSTVQAHHNATSCLVANLDVEKDFVCNLRAAVMTASMLLKDKDTKSKQEKTMSEL